MTASQLKPGQKLRIAGIDQTEYEKHIYMQDKMFPDWRKYWIYKDGKYIRKNTPLNELK